MIFSITDSSIMIHSLGWALLHSIWQGALMSVALWVLMKILGNGRAALKYNLSFAAMIGLAGWFFITWADGWKHLVPVLSNQVVPEAESSAAGNAYTLIQIPARIEAHARLAELIPNIDCLIPWIVGIYICGVLWFCFRLTAGVLKVRTLRVSALSLSDEKIIALFQALKSRLGLSANPALMVSGGINVPVMMGYFRPVILLPFSLLCNLDMPQLEAIILHELAHFRRRDYLLNIVQTIIETLLFFNPFIWWISAGIRREREHCCDDLVLQQTQQPLPYAAALATLEAYRIASGGLALAATGDTRYPLFNRIKRLTEMKKTPLGYGRITAVVTTVLMLAGAVIWLTPAFAQDKKQHPESRKTAVSKIIVIDDQGDKKEYSSVNELPPHERRQLRESMNEEEDLTKKLEELDENTAMSAMGDHFITAGRGKMQHDIDDAMKEARAAIMMADKEMKNVDWAKIDQEIAAAMKEVDKVNWDEVAAASGMGKSGRQMSVDIRKKLNAAREALDDANKTPPPPPIAPVLPSASAMPPAPPVPPHAPAFPNRYDAMLSQMDRDGLIDENGGFDIRKNSRDLYINGKLQPDVVKVKYRHFFSPGKVEIKGCRNNLSVNASN